MRRSCTLCFSISLSEKVLDVVGYIKGKCALMIHDKYLESVNGCSKVFVARGYYAATVRQYHRRCGKGIHSATKIRIEKGRY